MNLFEKLADAVQEEWQKVGHQLDSFPTVAARGLEKFKYEISKEELDTLLAEWFLSRPANTLPEQINVHNTFGQPPITVFNNDKFVVDIYIWLNFDTSIHSHGFRGAFRVLHGSSLHEEFTVKTLQQIALDVALTELGRPAMEVLQAGDVRTILPSQELTHRVIHLENPTVTLCVKTINEPEISQWHYFGNGLSIKKRQISPGLVKEIYYFQYLTSQNADLAFVFLTRLLDQLDISTQMNLCEDISNGAYDLTEDITQMILDQILVRHADEEWFARYEAVNLLHESDLHFETCDSPLLRLTAHFINCGLGLAAARPYLSQLAKSDLSKDGGKNLALSLLEVENIFALELSPKDLAEIRRLIENPAAEIPHRLLAVQQLPKIRSYVTS